MDDASDSNLLAAFRAGDREAFAVLVARHQGLVRAACLRQAPSGDAEDCIQAVFLVLSRRPGAAAGAPALAAWLLRVSWYVCRRAKRGAQRRRQAERQAAQASGRQPSLRPEALDHLDDCLAKLPERQRVAVSMQYLAERPADEVAAALGVSRDYAYQLVSRGLATLRSLLARRGIALSGPALLTLLAGEAQAATAGAGATASIALSLSATPSANAASLATGATTAMTLAAPSTITMMAASLLLAAGVTTAVVSAEPAQIPTAGPVQPVVLSALDKVLDQEVTVEFKDAEMSQVFNFVQTVCSGQSTTSMLVSSPTPENPKTTQRVTLKVTKMRLRNVLSHVGRLIGMTFEVKNNVLSFQRIEAIPPVKQMGKLDPAAAGPDMRKQLEKRLTFDFQDLPLTDVINSISTMGEVNCVIMPELRAGSPPLTLTVKDQALHVIVDFISKSSGLSVRYVDQALLFEVAAAEPQAPANGVAPNPTP